MANKPTRFYSNKQEKNVAATLNGRKMPNSGATRFLKGDVTTDEFLIECKTSTTDKKSFVIHKEWIQKNEKESMEMGKYYSAIAFDFGDNEQYYIINSRLFKKLVTMLKGGDMNG